MLCSANALVIVIIFYRPEKSDSKFYAINIECVSLQKNHSIKEKLMGTILLVILVLLLIGAIPAWPHSRAWGYGPSGGLGLVVIILLVLVLTGRL
jgi:hypothetical protein